MSSANSMLRADDNWYVIHLQAFRRTRLFSSLKYAKVSITLKRNKETYATVAVWSVWLLCNPTPPANSLHGGKKTCNTVAKKNSKNDVTSPVSTPSTPQYPVPFPIRERTHFQQGSCSLMYYGFQYTRWLSRARDKNEIWSVSYN